MAEHGDGPTRVRAPRVVVRYSKVRVEVVRGPDAGAALDVAGQPVRVGTADDNDLVLTDDSVSRHHCELEPVAGGMRVRDAGSTNGVFAGGVRVYDALVPFDARLRAGDTEIALAPSGETVEREQTTTDRFGDLLGCSPRMRELFADLERIAATDVTLLVEGETGTGKDLVAESVHRASARDGGPFVVFDCGAVSPSLAESELFGHERGAFTGAVQAHAGVFEQADGGTLLLDEVAELAPSAQAKLLRVLEEGTVEPLGANRTLEVNVRVISATHQQLKQRVAEGRFRPDLYYRLKVLDIDIPPLRERRLDLPLLVEHYLARFARPAARISTAAWALLERHPFPGNVRELAHAVERAVVLAGSGEIGVEHLPEEIAGPRAAALDAGLEPLQPALHAFEREHLLRALQLAGGKRARAAELLGISRKNLWEKLRAHGIVDTDGEGAHLAP